MSRNLPKFPNLEYLKKQAKSQLRKLQQQDPKARLTQAQHAIAREHGFASWPKLKAHVESLRRGTSLSGPSPVAEPQQGGAASGGGATSGPVETAHDSGGGSGLFPRFTEKARRTIFFARYFALRENKKIEAGHLFLGVVQADEELMSRIPAGQFQARPVPSPEEIASLKGSLAERASKLLEQFGRPPMAGDTLSITGDSPFSSEYRRVLELAAGEADRLRHQKITTGHFLLAFLREEVASAVPILRDVLKEKGIRPEKARELIARFLSEESL